MKKAGFTLIELMIAISIGIMMVTVGVVSINNFYIKQRVDSATNDIAGMVRLAKNYAVTMQSPRSYNQEIGFVGLLISSGGVVTVIPGNNAGGLDVGTSYASKIIDVSNLSISALSEGMVMFSVPEGKLLRFTGNGREAGPRLSTETVNILIRSKQDTTIENGVLIDSSGNISEKANLLGSVPDDASGDENTLTSNTPTPIRRCSDCNYYSLPSTACADICGSSCIPGVCDSYSISCNSINCYSAILR